MDESGGVCKIGGVGAEVEWVVVVEWMTLMNKVLGKEVTVVEWDAVV